MDKTIQHASSTTSDNESFEEFYHYDCDGESQNSTTIKSETRCIEISDSSSDTLSCDESESSEEYFDYNEYSFDSGTYKSKENDHLKLDNALDFDKTTNCLLNHMRKHLGLVNPANEKLYESKETFRIGSILCGKNLETRLKEWFPSESNELLKNISESHAINQNDERAMTDFYNRVLEKDETIIFKDKDGSQKSKFPFIRCRLFPPQEDSSILDIEFNNLFHLARDEFTERYQSNSFVTSRSNTNAPGVKYVDYIYNPDITREYEKYFDENKWNEAQMIEKRMFHGTHHDSIMPIISGNFDIEAKPIGRSKVMAHGRGVYFSDFSSFSLGYGSSLLMCRVISFTSDRKQNGPNNLVNIYVVPDTKRILPCYIIHLKK